MLLGLQCHLDLYSIICSMFQRDSIMRFTRKYQDDSYDYRLVHAEFESFDYNYSELVTFL